MQNKLFVSFGLIAIMSTAGFLYARQKLFNSNIIPNPVGNNRSDRNSLKVYRDPVHHYRISYPAYLEPIISDAVTHQEVTFVSEGDPWTIAVSVSTTTAASARMWVEEYNRKNYTGSPPYTTRYRIERETIINGIPAVVMHPYSDFQGQHEEYAYDQVALILKNGRLFTIGARTLDPEKIWNSFKFEE